MTKFDTSCVGTIDLENVGYTGTPINDHRYSNDRPAEMAPVGGVERLTAPCSAAPW